MDTSKLGNALAKLNAGQLFLYTVVSFAVILVIGMVIAYFIACRINKDTQMRGVMRISVSLNIWHEKDTRILPASSENPRLDYGRFLVGMQDLSGIPEELSPPYLNWLAKAFCRTYPVHLLLQKYRDTFARAIGEAEPSAVLLSELLKSGPLCDDLGALYRRKPERGLLFRGNAPCQKDRAKPDRLTVYGLLPETAAEKYQQSTACCVKTIGITMEYMAPDAIEGRKNSGYPQ